MLDYWLRSIVSRALFTCAVYAVPLALDRAACCGMLRNVATCRGENDATCRTAPRGTGPDVNTA